MTLSREDHADRIYSRLYSGGYPIGNPRGLVEKFDLSKDLKVVDLGCGRASLSTYFESYVGIDVSSYIIERNRETREGVFHRSSLTDLSDVRDFFDLAICADVMEHLPPEDVPKSLAEIARLKSPLFAFAISTRPSVFLDHEGGNLHLTIWSAEKWVRALEEDFEIRKTIRAPSLLSVLARAK